MTPCDLGGSVLLVVLSLVFVMTEFNGSRINSTVSDILSGCVQINAENAPNFDSWVWLTLENISFDVTVDWASNIPFRAAIVNWNVEYCQWQEEIGRDGFARAKRIWSDVLIESQSFVDKNRFNPKIPDFKKWQNSTDVRIGNIAVHKSLFDTSELQVLRGFLDSDIGLFKSSRMANDGFLYAGNGTFYRPYDIGKWEKQRVTGTCKAGDVRGWYSVYAPHSLTVVGWNSGGVIERREVDGYLVGNVLEDVSDAASLLKRHVKEATFRKTERVLLAFVFLVYASKWSNNMRNRALNFVTVTIWVMAMRSLVWNEGLMLKSVWLPICVGWDPVFGFTGRYTRFGAIMRRYVWGRGHGDRATL